MTRASLILKNVDITFEGALSSEEGLKSWLKRKLLTRNVDTATNYRIEALKGINLEINHGERVGLIGLNGAGKSTLLKVMADIYPPTAGSVSIKGHVCPMFEFATGFEMNQSGWDNIRIRGLLLGMSADAIEEKLPEIAAFTELGDFLDYPVRTYSSGMFIRLAFAVSTSINPEILLIDESYNANPASMTATLKQLGREKCDRRIAVLGEMRELGTQSARYHADLAEPVLEAHVDAAILVGREMAALAHRLHGEVDVRHVPDSAGALKALEEIASPGDVVLVKGSNAIGLSGLVREAAAGRLAHGKSACSM